MPQTTIQQENILAFLNQPEMRKLISAAQGCLWIKEINITTLKRQLFKKTQRLRGVQIPPQIKNELESITAQIVDILPCTRMQFVHDFIEDYLEKSQTDSKMPVPAVSAFETHLAEAYHHIGITMPLHLRSWDKTEEAMSALDAAGTCAIMHYNNQHTSVFDLGWFFLFYLCTTLKAWQNDKLHMEFAPKLIEEFMLATIFAGMIWKWADVTVFSHYKKRIQRSASFSIEQIHMVGAQNTVSYLPVHRPVEEIAPVLSETKEAAATENESKEEELAPSVSKKQKTRSPVSFFTSLYATVAPASSIRWPSASVLQGNAVGEITLQDVHEMHAPYFSEHTRYYGFFNKAALRGQHLEPESAEWKSYAERIERGKVVRPQGETGIKKLTPAMLISTEIGHLLFLWAAKKIGTVNRLLAHEVPVLSTDGTRHVLVDFSHHMERGPGH